jgi:hypothetical protein
MDLRLKDAKIAALEESSQWSIPQGPNPSGRLFGLLVAIWQIACFLLWVFSQERDLFVCLSGVTRIQL